MVDMPHTHLNKTPALFSPVLSVRVPVVQVPRERRCLKIRAGDSEDPKYAKVASFVALSV